MGEVGHRPVDTVLACVHKALDWVSTPTVLQCACQPGVQQVEAGGQEVQGHLWLRGEFEASLGYMKACLKL